MERKNSRCPSYISNICCEKNVDVGYTWCNDCGKIFTKKQVRCKTLEKKYYNEDHIVPNFNFAELYKLYNKLALILSLRRYVYNYGFYPEVRDNGHYIRIEKIRRYKKLVKYEMENKSIEEDKKEDPLEQDEEDEISNNDESRSVSPPKKKTSDVKKIKEKVEIITHGLVNQICSTIVDMSDGCDDIAKDYITPKLGKNFWTAFCLQHVLMGNFCEHKSISTKNKRFMQNVYLNDLEHNYCDKGKSYAPPGKVLTECSTEKKYLAFMRTETFANTIYKTTKLDAFLQLHRQVPTLPLHKWIKRVVYNPTDKDIEKITALHYKKYKISRAHKKKREQKINLLRNKREKDYDYDLQSCMRANTLGDREMSAAIAGTDRPEKYRLYYYTENNGLVNITQTTVIDVTNYACNHTFGPIIVLNESILDICGKKADKYLDLLKQVFVLVLESRSKYVFTF